MSAEVQIEEVRRRSSGLVTERIQRTRVALIEADESEGVADVDLIVRDVEELLLILEFRRRKREERRRGASRKLVDDSAAAAGPTAKNA